MTPEVRIPPNSPISFPNLGIEIQPKELALPITDNWGIHWYGILIAAGFVLAVLYALRRVRQFGLTQDHILDMLFYAVPAAVICARAYYCIFYWDNYKHDPISVLYIWEGGIAIYGAVIGAVAAVLLYCKVKKVPIGPMMDIGALGLMIGQMIGRWGNFVNREAFGAETDSFLKMGLQDQFGNVAYYHPTFFYESAWNFVGFLLLHFYSKRRKFDGEIFALYVAWYGLGRSWIEGLRKDSLYLFGTGIRVSQLLAVLSCGAAVAYLVIKRRTGKKELYVNQETQTSACDNTENSF